MSGIVKLCLERDLAVAEHDALRAKVREYFAARNALPGDDQRWHDAEAALTKAVARV